MEFLKSPLDSSNSPPRWERLKILPPEKFSVPPENFGNLPAENLHEGVCSAGCCNPMLIPCSYVLGDVRFPKPVYGTASNKPYIQGIVEIFHRGQWGTVCDDKFNNNAAKVICRMQGYSGGTFSRAYHQRGASPATKIWLDDVECTGKESDIGLCKHLGWGIDNCGKSEDVGIRCYIVSKGMFNLICFLKELLISQKSFRNTSKVTTVLIEIAHCWLTATHNHSVM